MGWEIQTQTEKIGKEEIQTRVKRVKFFPIEGKDGSITFGKLGFLLLRVIIKNGDRELKLNLNASEGALNPKFTIAHPDKEDYPMFWHGHGKRRRQYADLTAKKVKIPGEREKFDDAKLFSARVNGFRPGLGDEVLGLFAGRLASIESANKGNLMLKDE